MSAGFTLKPADETLRRLVRERNEARDEVERLRAEVERLTRERDEARAEIERMREALQPFAAEAQRYDPDDGDDLHPAWNSRFEIKHLRAARKALEAKP